MELLIILFWGPSLNQNASNHPYYLQNVQGSIIIKNYIKRKHKYSNSHRILNTYIHTFSNE